MQRNFSLAAFVLGFSPLPALAAVPATGAIIPLPLNPIVPAAQRVCTAQTASGLGYSQLRAGAGAKPGRDAVTLVNYVGYLAASGAVFDQGMSSALPVDGVIPGFGEGMMLAGKGAILRLCIPAALGYGAAGTGPIPANAALVFQIELVDFKTRAEIAALREQAQIPAAQAPANPAGATQAPPPAPAR